MKSSAKYAVYTVLLALMACRSDPPATSPIDASSPTDASPPIDGPTGPLELELLAGYIGGTGNLDGVGAAAHFAPPFDVAADSDGNVYVADMSNHTIRKVTPAGVVTTLAGTADASGSTDGTGAAARFYFPSGVAIDGAGNVYVADQYNHTIRKITAAGEVTTLAGTAGVSGSTDGTGAAAQFHLPSDVGVDSVGNVYVADQYNHTIRKVTAAGVVTTLAGTAGVSGSTDGTGIAARFNRPGGVAVDSTGNVYVADTDNHVIRKVTAEGVVTTLAGTAGMPGNTDDTGIAARFKSPDGVAVDSNGNVYVADTGNSTIRKISAAGAVMTLAGAGLAGSVDGTGTAARFNGPRGVTVDSTGNVYVGDSENFSIRKVTAAGVVTTLAGTPRPSGGSADGTGAAARFGSPNGVAVYNTGNVIYVADSGSSIIRKITATGTVTTLAGTYSAGNYPCGVAVDSAGNMYIADYLGHTIRKVTPAGIVTTLAGNPGGPGSTDGVGVTALFDHPSSVAVDRAANIYVADSWNHTIRKVTPTGVVTTLAGTAGVRGSSDGTGAAARFYYPFGVAVDSAGNVYVADQHNFTIRKITPAGDTTTIAGVAGMMGVLLGTTPRLSYPSSLAIIGDSIVISDAYSILLLRHGAR